MKAFLLAAGLGKRLRPLTDHLPKPLVEVAGKPLIQWHIEKLRDAGIGELVINCHWLGELLQARLGDGRDLDVAIRWSFEPELLDTGGGIRAALPLLGTEQPFALVSADCWTDLSYQWLTETDLQGALAQLMMVPNPEFHPAGDFGLDAQGWLRPRGLGMRDLTYSGIGLIDPSWVAQWEAPAPIFPLIQPLAQAIGQGRVRGALLQGHWTDVGTPQRLQELQYYLAG